MWNVGSSATPMGLPERLRALGLGDPEPPFEPFVAAMALEHEPPAVDGVDVRRIETLEEHLAGLEIMLASATLVQRSGGRRTRALRGGLRAPAATRRPAMARLRRGQAGRIRSSRSRYQPGSTSAAPRRCPRRADEAATALWSARAGTRRSGWPYPALPCKRNTGPPRRSCVDSDSQKLRLFTRSSSK